MTNRITLVAGGGGFIGGHLVGYLQEKRHEQICAGGGEPPEGWDQVHPGVENVIADLDHREACLDACRNAGEIYNLAADMGGMGFIENNKALCMLSVLINTHLLLAAKEEGATRYFYASSACVYNGEKQKS